MTKQPKTSNPPPNKRNTQIFQQMLAAVRKHVGDIPIPVDSVKWVSRCGNNVTIAFGPSQVTLTIVHKDGKDEGWWSSEYNYTGWGLRKLRQDLKIA